MELAGIGPVPHAAMLLADLGADVIRIEAPGRAPLAGPRRTDLLTRGRPSLLLDLKEPTGVETVLRMAERADVLLEGMRPGTAERLGVGPDQCCARNPALVYGRMTGWGQSGPLAGLAGHDLNYIGLSGTLHGLGQTPECPQFPVNLLGDFGGGSLYLVVGVLAALLEARGSGLGQVVDAAIVDGAAHLNAMTLGLLAGGAWQERRGTNLLDGGAPFYALYETADGRHMSVAALEEPFYAELLDRLGLREVAPDRTDPAQHPALRELLAATFRTRTQAQWCAVLAGSDACCWPVLTMVEATEHPHLRERGVLVEVDGIRQPAPAPRFSRTPATLTTGPSRPGEGGVAALRAWGIGGGLDASGG